MQFLAQRPIYGDYGLRAKGEVFDVTDPVILKRLRALEAKGIVTRYRFVPERKAYTVYENKAIQLPENKSGGALRPPMAKGAR